MAPHCILKLLKNQKQWEPTMSFHDSLSKIWFNIQYSLFPTLEKEMGELSELHKKLISILELIRIEEGLPCTRFCTGRPPKHRAAMARALIAKVVFKITYVKQLVKYLKLDKQLRNICGWDSASEIPSESKFSRAFKEFAESTLPEKVHQALIKDYYQDELVGHVSKDSTPIEVREKYVTKKKSQPRKRKARRKKGELNRRQKQLQEVSLEKIIKDLPTCCDKGMKRSAQGNTMIWKGYKLHTAVDDNCVPLAVIVTSASLNDCEAAIPLARKCNNVVTNMYDLMDAAYDHPEIKEHSISLGHIPIIDKCPSGRAQKVEKEAEKSRKKILNFKTAEDKRYRERFKTERFNALYKDYYGGRTIRYIGYLKVSCEIMFGVLALAGSQLLSLVQ
jgi:hypothetical protein